MKKKLWRSSVIQYMLMAAERDIEAYGQTSDLINYKMTINLHNRMSSQIYHANPLNKANPCAGETGFMLSQQIQEKYFRCIYYITHITFYYLIHKSLKYLILTGHLQHYVVKCNDNVYISLLANSFLHSYASFINYFLWHLSGVSFFSFSFLY